MRARLPTPSRSPLAIGAKLRTSRLAQGLTLADVAETTGLNKGFLSKIERDETSPSITTLVAICEALSLQVGSLFEEPDLQVIPLATAPLINMGGLGVVEKLVSPRSEPGVQMLRSVLSPGATGGKELYTVNCDLEVVHVLSGQLTLRFTASTRTLMTDDTLTIPGREPHTWVNGWDGDTELIWTIVPAAWSGSSV